MGYLGYMVTMVVCDGMPQLYGNYGSMWWDVSAIWLQESVWWNNGEIYGYKRICDGMSRIYGYKVVYDGIGANCEQFTDLQNAIKV